MRENKKTYVFLRFACSEEEYSKFICMHSFFWCRKINLNGDKKTANERVEFHKAKWCKKVCFDFKLLKKKKKKLGPTMNGCWSSSPEGKLATKEPSLNGTGTEAPTMIEVLKIGEHRVGNVATIKDGTVKWGLPSVTEGKGISCCSWKAPPCRPIPEAKNVSICWDKLGD